MTTFQYAIVLEAEKILTFPEYRPKGWERTLEWAADIKKFLDSQKSDSKTVKD